MKIWSVSPESFRYRSTFEEWTEVRDWMEEHNITWHALGDNIISFDNKEHAIMFALRWL